MPKAEKIVSNNKKKSVWVKIKEHGESSPHLLNLHELTLDLRSEHQPDETDSFEEKIAALDERMREMPDLLKTQAASVSKFWEQRADFFFNRASSFGSDIQKRFARATKKTTKKITTKHRAYQHSISQLPQFSLILVLLFLITVPLQALLLYRTIHDSRATLLSNWTNANTHIGTLQTAIQTNNLTDAHSELEALLQNLTSMRKVADRWGVLRALLPSRLQLADALLHIAEQGVSSVSYLAGQLLNVQAGTDTPGTLIRTARQELLGITAALERPSYKNDSTEFLTTLSDKIKSINDAFTVVSELYGAKEPRTILLVFQNPRELRATGGFAGSFALLRTRDGALESIEAPEGGSYSVQGQLSLQRVSPQPLHLINPRFEFQDANWWPDFPRSARKITELYEAAGGPTLDAVVAITTHVGEEILKLYGPLSTNEGEINAENFTDTLQTIIARDRAADPSTPKRIITSLMPDMQKALTQTAAKQPKQLLQLTTQLLEQKDIQVWSTHEETQAALKRLGWSGELRQTQGDYLAVITSNVAGGKTDGVVTESVDHETYITANDGVEHDLKAVARKTITIRRTHNGTKNDPTLGYRNVSYIRVYVPEQAQLISVSGNNPPPPYLFENPGESLTPDPDVRASEAILKQDSKSGTEIWSEDQKTIFGLWLMVDPGESSELTLTYDLPLKTYNDTIPYTLTVDPQSGKDIQFKGKITLDEHLKTLTGNQDGSWDIKGWEYEGPLKKTLVTSGVLYRL